MRTTRLGETHIVGSDKEAESSDAVTDLCWEHDLSGGRL